MDYYRKYLNDSVYIESHGDVSDTMLVNGSCMYILHGGGKYKLLDVDEDFKPGTRKFRYYYFGINVNDTVQRKNEPDVHYKLRLMEAIAVYVPQKIVTVDGRQAYVYYVIGECYPITANCVDNTIGGSLYGVGHFEKGLGTTFHGRANSECEYQITEESYKKLLKWKKGN